jgi:hypothetical protein
MDDKGFGAQGLGYTASRRSRMGDEEYRVPTWASAASTDVEPRGFRWRKSESWPLPLHGWR